MSKKKLIMAYILYIAAIVGIYSKAGINLINGDPGRIPAGIAVFVLLTAVIITLTAQFVKAGRTDYLINIGIEDKKTEMDRLGELVDFFRSAKDRRSRGEMTEIAKMSFSAGLRMIEKQTQLAKLLAETFSENDLTYTSYMESIDEITNIFNNNLKGIRKRMEVFDSADDDSGVMSIYISESKALEDRNEQMLDTLDNLLLEVVRLEDTGDTSLVKLNGLIEQTKLYKEEEV